MGTVARLTVDLVANSARLRAEFVRSTRSAKTWSQATRQHISSVSKYIVGTGVATTGVLTAMYASAAQEGDKLAKTADKLGVLPEALSGLQHAGELTGVAVETTNMALQRMTRRVAEAAVGTGEAKGALQELGIDARRLAQLSPDKQFKEIARAMEGVSNQGDRVRLSMKLFDSEGVALVNTLALGKEGLNAVELEAKQLGLTLDRMQLAKIESANDAFYRANIVSSAFSKSLAAEAAPIVEGLSNHFVTAAKEAGGFGRIAQSAVHNVTRSVGFLADSVHGLSVVWEGVKTAAITTVASSVSALAGLDRIVTNFLDGLPVISASVNKNLQERAKVLAKQGEAASQAFQEALMKPMPSEKVKAWVEDVQQKATQAAESVANSKAVINTDVAATVTTQVDSLPADIESIRQKLLTEEEALSESYTRRQELLDSAHSAGQLSDEKYRELLLKNSKQYFEKDAKLAAEKKATTLQNYGQLFDGLAGISEAANGKQTGIYRAMFAASKAFSVAEAAVKIQAGIANATVMPYPKNLAAMASVVAATSSILTTIKGTKMQSFDGGGFTGRGQRSGGMDGKGGFMAMLHPNETVIDHTKNSGTIKNMITVNVIEDTHRAGEVSSNDDNIDIYVDRFRRAMIEDVSRGRGLGDAIKNKFNLTTRAGA